MKITISTNVNATIEKAWDAMKNPDSITQWNFASPDWHCPKSSVDFKIGGRMCSTMAAKDGSFAFDFEATFLEIIPHKKMVYELDDKRLVEIFFEEKNGFIEVTEMFDAENQNPIEMQQMGWQAILNNYKTYCEKL